VRSWPPAGEIGLALAFAATGVVWIAGAAGMPLWEGFAPHSGFLPLIYGVLLTALSGAVLISLFLSERSAAAPPTGKPLLVLAAVGAAVVGVAAAGFGVATFLMLLFLFAVVEKRSVLKSALASVATTAALILIFRTWLGVPLPAGPLGI
jgi:putative tricarboxylic transport membrane protein